MGRAEEKEGRYMEDIRGNEKVKLGSGKGTKQRDETLLKRMKQRSGTGNGSKGERRNTDAGGDEKGRKGYRIGLSKGMVSASLQGIRRQRLRQYFQNWRPCNS